MSNAIPTVVIVGRPNVGKSTLFNRITGQRRAIVGDEPGITRDRIHGSAEHQGRRFEVIDTGGIVVHDQEYIDRKSTRLNSSHRCISYAVFCLKKKKKTNLIYNVNK